jgi:phosphatidylserine decarboxylase
VAPFAIGSVALGIATGVAVRLCGCGSATAPVAGLGVGGVALGYMLYFFRDPERVAPESGPAIVAGADGVVANIKNVPEDQHLHTTCVRISIFLNLFNVHVNRAPIGGDIAYLGYTPGRHFFTFREKSSDYNQHNTIVIQGTQTGCVVKQIVGPVCRRVVHWLHVGRAVGKGERIGMMKFGSRLDMYLPADDVEVGVRVGDVVRAGETVVASLREGPTA